jgi:Mrp family chromosome partitioning ATPase
MKTTFAGAADGDSGAYTFGAASPGSPGVNGQSSRGRRRFQPRPQPGVSWHPDRPSGQANARTRRCSVSTLPMGTISKMTGAVVVGNGGDAKSTLACTR